MEILSGISFASVLNINIVNTGKSAVAFSQTLENIVTEEFPVSFNFRFWNVLNFLSNVTRNILFNGLFNLAGIQVLLVIIIFFSRKIYTQTWVDCLALNSDSSGFKMGHFK